MRKDDEVRYKVWYKSEMNLEMNEIYQESPSPLNDQLLPKFKLSMRQHCHSSVVKVGLDRTIIHWGQMACGCLFDRDHCRLWGVGGCLLLLCRWASVNKNNINCVCKCR